MKTQTDPHCRVCEEEPYIMV